MPEIKRQKLTIKEVHEPKSFGNKGGQKVEFVCDGKKWVTFKKALFSYIIAGTEIDADTERKERPHENGVYIDFIVQDIYVDGKSVSPQSKPYQYQAKGYSPEERASIETQQAAKFTANLWIADKLDKDSAEVKALRIWLLLHLNAEKPQKATGPSKIITPANIVVAEPGEITLAVPSDQSPRDPKTDPSPKELKRDPKTLKTYTQLCKACNEDWPGMQPKDVLAELNVNTQSEITDTMPDCYITIAAVRQGPKEQE